MTHLIGQSGLIVGSIAGATSAVMSVAAARSSSDAWARRTRGAMLCMCFAILASFGALLIALCDNDLSLAYVRAHSSADTPIAFRLAAAWSGSAGSLLLLTTCTAAVGAVIAVRLTRSPARHASWALGMISSVCGMLTLVVLLADNPFEIAARTLAGNGHGLDLRLRHWAMIVHPPLIMLGYSACVGAMSVALSGACGGDDVEALRSTRRWSMLAWASLGCGMLLGARWAYTQLGWGGYWNWDPVENASLVPLLMCTGAVHSLRRDAHSRRLSAWSLAFVTLASGTALFGGWITRSGSIASVHAFARSGSAIWMLGLGLGVAALGLWRCAMHRPVAACDSRTRSPALWEHTIAWGNVLLLAAGLGTLAGTLAPLLTGLSGERSVGVTATYYQRFVVVPLLFAMVLMVIGLGSTRAAQGRPRAPRSALLSARTASVLVAHTGVVLLACGIGASSLLGTTVDVAMARAEEARIGAYTLTYTGARQFAGAGYESVEASIRITSPSGPAYTLTPERRFDARDPLNAASEGSLHMGLGTDVFVSLVGWDAGGERVALHVRVLPLASWIWIGGGLCVIGMLAVAMLPSAQRRETTGLRMIDSMTLAPNAARERATA